MFHGGLSNLYEYCVNDPLNRFDNGGLQETFGQWLANILGYQPNEEQAQAQAEQQSSCPNVPTQQQMDQLQMQAVNNFMYAEGMGSSAGVGAVLFATTLGQLGDWGLLITAGRAGLSISGDNPDYARAISIITIGTGSNVTGVPAGPALMGTQYGAATYMYYFPPPPPLGQRH